MKQIFDQTTGTFARPVALDAREQADIWDMFHESPALTVGIEAFFGLAFCNPPQIKMPNLRLKQNDDLEVLAKTVLETWRRDVYKRIRAFGVVPYLLKAVNDDFVPIVPPVESGHIETFYDYKNHEQVFLWFWKNQTSVEPAKGIEWIVESPPTLDGKFTSAGKSLLMLWKDIKLSTTNAQRIDHITCHAPIFMEHNPPKNKPGDDVLTGMAFGDVEEGFVDQELHARELNHQIMERGALNRALLHAYAKNRGSDAIGSSKPELWSEDDVDRYKREGNLWYERAVPLPDYWKISQPTPPKMARDPIVLRQEFNQLASAAVNFPIEMLFSQHANKTGNAELLLRAANERIKNVLTRFEEYYRTMIIQTYGRRFKAQKEYLKARVHFMRKKPMTLKENLELSQLFKVEVKMICTSLTTQEQLEGLWRNGVINQETYGRHSSALIGLPETDMDIQKQDLIFPGTVQELKMQQKYAPKPQNGEGKGPISSSGTKESPTKKKSKDGKRKETLSEVKEKPASKKPKTISTK